MKWDEKMKEDEKEKMIQTMQIVYIPIIYEGYVEEAPQTTQRILTEVY